MSRTFRGEGHHKVDNKGRVSIPALFRRVVEACDPEWTSPEDNPNLVIVYGGVERNYLEVYTIEAINEVDAKIAKLPRGSRPRRMLERMIHGQSFPTTIDDTGRLVLPAKLREKIDLDKEAFFIAAGDTFQIWKPETYEQDAMGDVQDWFESLPEGTDPMEFLEGLGEG